MANPERFANSPTPGQNLPLTSLSGNGGSISSGAASMKVAGAAPATFQGVGQGRVIIEQELIIVDTTTTSTTTWTILTRGAEGTTAATHLDGISIYQPVTEAALGRFQQLGGVDAGKSTNYTALSTDSFIRVDSTAATRTVTLPISTTCKVGQPITVKDIGTTQRNWTSVAAGSGDTIDNGTVTLGHVEAGVGLRSATFITDGAGNWYLYSALPSVVPTGAVTWFRPEDYGATGNGTTDDTTAFINCLADAGAAGNAEVHLKPLTYKCTGGLQTGNGGNAQIPLPTSFHRIVLVGAEGTHPNSYTGSKIQCAIANSQNYDNTKGCPSVIGGPTREGYGGANTFQNSDFHIRDVVITLPYTAGNPTTMCGVDLSRIAQQSIYGLGVTPFNTTDNPKNGASNTLFYQFGIRLADPGNNGRVYVDGGTLVQGCVTGLVTGSAHTNLRDYQSERCLQGIGLIGNTYLSANDPHSGFWAYVQTAHCTYHIGGWSPTSGPPFDLPANKPFYVVIGNWDIEDAAGNDSSGNPYPSWCFTAFHVYDNNNNLYGNTQFQNVLANSGVVTSRMPLAVRGAQFFTLRNIACPLSNLSNSGGFPSTPVSGTPYENDFGDTVQCSVQYTLSPTGAAAGSVQLQLSKDGVTYTNFAFPSMPANGPAYTGVITFPLGNGWFFKATSTNATLGSLQIIG